MPTAREGPSEVEDVPNVGAERMLGYTAAEVMNTITPADISDPQELIARALRAEVRARPASGGGTAHHPIYGCSTRPSDSRPARIHRWVLPRTFYADNDGLAKRCIEEIMTKDIDGRRNAAVKRA